MMTASFGDEGEMRSQFDPDLPTANHVLKAIACVASQYALNPSLHLAKLALRLATNLLAPEYGYARSNEQVAHRLIAQWDCIVEKYMAVDASVIPQHQLLQ
jgi:hypothetical protein